MEQLMRLPASPILLLLLIAGPAVATDYKAALKNQLDQEPKFLFENEAQHAERAVRLSSGAAPTLAPEWSQSNPDPIQDPAVRDFWQQANQQNAQQFHQAVQPLSPTQIESRAAAAPVGAADSQGDYDASAKRRAAAALALEGYRESYARAAVMLDDAAKIIPGGTLTESAAWGTDGLELLRGSWRIAQAAAEFADSFATNSQGVAQSKAGNTQLASTSPPVAALQQLQQTADDAFDLSPETEQKLTALGVDPADFKARFLKGDVSALNDLAAAVDPNHDAPAPFENTDTIPAPISQSGSLAGAKSDASETNPRALSIELGRHSAPTIAVTHYLQKHLQSIGVQTAADQGGIFHIAKLAYLASHP